MGNENRRIIFLHLPKNAGTTMNSILKKKYSKKEIFQIGYNESGIWNLNEFKELSQYEKDEIKFLTGHFNFGLHEHFSNRFEYITMMRNPVERTISFYNYVKRLKDHRLLDVVKNKSLLECVTEIKDFDVVNGQARKLSGTNDESLMLKKALENIEQHFTFVGIQENFEESMILLNDKVNLKIRTLNHLNRAGLNSEIDNELIMEIEKQNQIDIELYNIMKNRFFEDLSKVKNLTTKKILLKTSGKIKATYNRMRK